MTILIAAKGKKKTFLAADTLITQDNKKIKKLKNFSKITKFKNFYCASAGLCNIIPVLTELSKLEKEDYFYNMKSLDDCYEFSKEVFKRFKKNIEDAPSYDSSDTYIQLLIISKGKIFTVNSYLDVSEPDSLYCVGSGEDIAMGAMSVLYKRCKTDQDLVDAMKEAIKVTSDHITDCSPPIHIVEI